MIMLKVMKELGKLNLHAYLFHLGNKIEEDKTSTLQNLQEKDTENTRALATNAEGEITNKIQKK